MKPGDKVYYHPRHHVKKKATWLCWITRGDRRWAMITAFKAKEEIKNG